MSFKKTVLLLTLTLILVFPVASSARDKHNSNSENLLEEFTPYEMETGDLILNLPNDLAYSSRTNSLIIADTGNHRILSLNLSSLEITTIAGFTKGLDRFGSPGGGFVDGSTGKAMFNYPKGVAVAQNGTILVADTGNHAIRQIQGNTVSTIAGGKASGYLDGKGLSANFLGPENLALDDKENIFVSDTLNNCIRKIDSTGKVTTYAGDVNDPSIFNEPTGLSFGKDGYLYVVDSANHQIKRIIAENEVEIVAGSHKSKDADSGYWLGDYMNGEAASSAFNFPKGIYVKDDGKIFVSDTSNHYIRSIVDSKTQTIAGGGVAGNDFLDRFISLLEDPSGMVYVDSTLYLADKSNNRIIAIPDPNGSLADKQVVDLEGENIAVFVNGKETIFPDIEPFYMDETLLIPIRFVAEEWGAEVGWDGKNRIISLVKDGQQIELSFRKGDFLLNKGRSLVDVEVFMEKLGFDLRIIGGGSIVLLES